MKELLMVCLLDRTILFVNFLKFFALVIWNNSSY